MARLFLIIGKSSTGKDTIYNRLFKREDISLKRVVPYTTRPIRRGETEGVDYLFCDIKKMEEYRQQKKIIEIRKYPTVHGDWYYFTADDGQIAWEGEDLAMIGTLESYNKLKEYYKTNEIIPIYIEVEDGIRLSRALERERRQSQPRYEEMCRRFLADSEDYSQEKLKEAGIHIVFENDDMEKTVEDIAMFIKGK